MAFNLDEICPVHLCGEQGQEMKLLIQNLLSWLYLQRLTLANWAFQHILRPFRGQGNSGRVNQRSWQCMDDKGKQSCGSLQESWSSTGAHNPKSSPGKLEWSLALQLKICPVSEGKRHGKKANKYNFQEKYVISRLKECNCVLEKLVLGKKPT